MTTKQFKPMLAATIEDINDLVYPVLVSPKLDGIRALVRNGVLVSRNLKPIPNAYCQKLFGGDRFEGLDGELIVGKPTGNDVWARSQSGVMKKTGEPAVCFHVFDCTTPFLDDNSYPTRQFHIANKLSNRLWSANLAIVPQHKAFNAAELSKLEAKFVAEGYEGVMVRQLKGKTPYKFGRSTLREGLLMKLVRKHTMEGVVVGLVEQQHNGNEATKDALGRTKRSTSKAGKTGKGTLGALKLVPHNDRRLGPNATVCQELVDDLTFEVGSGLDDATRTALWAKGRKLHGSVVKIEYRELTPDGKPRFPVFLGLRDARDMDATTQRATRKGA